MKLRQLAPQTIHTTGFDKGERTKFKMATSAKTYKIMSSTIYKYKIRAIIREISSNAIDGHMVAGNMNPFDVQLPTVLDPRFIVRDYGTGLSDWMVKEVFATYFESTKTDTDELIGALGLGSKSSFCYTETFTIESIQDGVKRAYTAYMDNGEPFVDQIYETETDEPNGVQITVPVKVEDIAEWEREAARVYEPFTGIRPRFIGVQVDVNWQPKEADDRGSSVISLSTIQAYTRVWVTFAIQSTWTCSKTRCSTATVTAITRIFWISLWDRWTSCRRVKS